MRRTRISTWAALSAAGLLVAGGCAREAPSAVTGGNAQRLCEAFGATDVEGVERVLRRSSSGGVVIVQMCDLCVAADDARFMFPEAKLEKTELHSPPNTRHVTVGAGSGPCLVIAVGARGHDTLGFLADEVARRHSASVEEDTTDGGVAYASVPRREPTACRLGSLPDQLSDAEP
jgi:hypothetical protein